jgi:hypothetical protein
MFNEEEIISDMNEENFSSKQLFNKRTSNEDVLNLFEHIAN